MKNFLLVCAAVVVGAGTAFATDMPYRAPAPIYKATPAYSWSGLYGGIHGGYGFGENEITDTVTGLAGKFKPAGGFGGVQLGYNTQFAPHWMIGSQIDLSAGSIDDSITAGGATGKNTFNTFGTARTRFGYVQDRTFIYGTGGAIWLRDKYTATSGGASTDSAQYHVSWVWGAGIEYAFDPRWSLNLEYLYAPFDKSRDISGAAGAPTRRADADFSMVRAGLNYRFSDGAAATYMPAKAPAPHSAWNGGYLGLHGGYGWSTTNKFDGFVPLTANLDPKGAFGGVQGGYNWLYAPNALLGIEIDSSYGDLKQTASGGGVTATSKISDLGTARLRLGYLMTPDTLLYATGGLAYAREKSTDNNGTGGDTKVDHLGWTVGAGAEYMFAPQWSLKAEYLYADLDTFKDNNPVGGITKKSDLTLSTVKVGINYYGPVIERLFTR